MPGIIILFTFLLTPIGLIIAAVLALIAVGLFWVVNWEKIKSGLLFIWEGLQFRFNSMKSSLVSDLRIMSDAFKAMFDFVKEKAIDPLIALIDSLMDKINKVVSTIKSVSGGIGGFIAEPFRRTLGGFQAGIDSVPRTGNFLLHKGERVIPAGGMMGRAITVNINGGVFLSEDVAEEIGDMIIDKLKRTIKI